MKRKIFQIGAILILLAMVGAPVLATITVPFHFAPYTTISSSQVNSNFSTIAEAALNRHGDTADGDITSSAKYITTSTATNAISATAGGITVFKGVTAGSGGVGIIGTDGRIPNVGPTYFADLTRVPQIQTTGRQASSSSAIANVAQQTCPASDSSYEVSANVLVTTATTHNFQALVAYTDESNTGRSLPLSFLNPAGTAFVISIINTAGAGPYAGFVAHIRCKANTTITVSTSGTFTTVTYNIEAVIKQVR